MERELRRAALPVLVAAPAVLMLALPGSAGATSVPAKSSTPSASSLVSSAQKAMRRQTGVQEVASVVESGNRATITIDAGKTGGTEVGSFDEKSEKGTARVVETHSKAYLTGDKNGLVASGFTTKAASKEAGKWIAISTTSSYGKSLAAGLTVSSASSDIDISGSQHLKLHLATNKHVDGTRVDMISTSASGETVDLYLRANGAPLPVEIRAKAGSALSETITFSHWGHAPKVSAPKSSVRFQTGWLQSGTTG